MRKIGIKKHLVGVLSTFWAAGWLAFIAWSTKDFPPSPPSKGQVILIAIALAASSVPLILLKLRADRLQR